MSATTIQYQSWVQRNLYLEGEPQIASSMQQACETCEISRIEATKHAIHAIATALFNSVRYLAIGGAEFVYHASQLEFSDSWEAFSANMKSCLRNSVFIALGSVSVVAGLFFPKMVYKFMAPTQSGIQSVKPIQDNEEAPIEIIEVLSGIQSVKPIQDNEEAPIEIIEVSSAPEVVVRHYRNFYAPPSIEDEKKIRYIYTTLAHTGYFSLMGCQEKLETAGEQIMSVHPLKILEFAFSNEELKECMILIKDRFWIMKGFSGEMGDRLQLAKDRGNLTEKEISDFANKIEVDASLISSLIGRNDWEEFLKTVINSTSSYKKKLSGFTS